MSDQIKEAVFAGREILAIRLYREQTGAGLKEAKDAVEKLEAELRISSPNEFSKPSVASLSPFVAVHLIIAFAFALTLGLVLLWMFRQGPD